MADVAGIWAVVPAAGVGARMRSAVPKQYLALAGRPVILHTLERLCTHTRVQGVLVGLAAGDSRWADCAAACGRLPRFLGTYLGGETRGHTVLNGLKVLSLHARADDWVLVHDAVRPCVRHADIDKLVDTVLAGEQGGLLALPVTDTVKRAGEDGRVLETVAREGLWRALTPQLFRLGQLSAALEQALAGGHEITDEAAAMEAAGFRPRLVAGSPDNVKITLPADIALAELYLSRQALGPAT